LFKADIFSEFALMHAKETPGLAEFIVYVRGTNAIEIRRYRALNVYLIPVPPTMILLSIIGTLKVQIFPGFTRGGGPSFPLRRGGGGVVTVSDT
jgi:hypothetical protein